MFKIALDAGHGLHTGGKRCLRSLDPNETREWWLNNRICDEIERILATECKLGEDYDLIRLDDTTGETDVSLDSRVAKANNFKADYLLSIHHNAGAKGTSVGGPTVHIRPNRGEDSWQKMGVLWDNFIGQVNKLGFSNRMSSNVWVNRFKVISGIKDACLFECGFMDSRVDINYILREDYAMAAARGFANGLMQIGGLVPSNPQSSTENSEVNQQPSDEKEEENTSDNNNNHIYDNYWDFMSSLSSNSSSSKDNPSNEKQETPEKDEEHRFSTSTGGDYITKPLSPYNNLLYHPQRKEIESLYKIGILTIKDETSDSNKNYFKTDGEWISRGDFALLLYLTRCYFMGTPSESKWEELLKDNGGYHFPNDIPDSKDVQCKAVEFLYNWGIIDNSGTKDNSFRYTRGIEKAYARKWLSNLYLHISGKSPEQLKESYKNKFKQMKGELSENV